MTLIGRGGGDGELALAQAAVAHVAGHVQDLPDGLFGRLLVRPAREPEMLQRSTLRVGRPSFLQRRGGEDDDGDCD